MRDREDTILTQERGNKFKDYLNQNGDSAEIESDVDGGITFCCLITTKELEELVSEHEKFLAQAE